MHMWACRCPLFAVLVTSHVPRLRTSSTTTMPPTLCSLVHHICQGRLVRRYVYRGELHMPCCLCERVRQAHRHRMPHTPTRKAMNRITGSHTLRMKSSGLSGCGGNSLGRPGGRKSAPNSSDLRAGGHALWHVAFSAEALFVSLFSVAHRISSGLVEDQEEQFVCIESVGCLATDLFITPCNLTS